MKPQARSHVSLAIGAAAALGLVSMAGGFTAGAAETTQSSVSYVLTDGRIVPESDYAIRVDIIGTAFTSGGTPLPITLEINLGDEAIEPFGDADSPAGNINQPTLPTASHVFPSMRSIDDHITITATSWYNGQQLYTHNSHGQSALVKVLRNGDDVPNVSGFDGQEDAEYFLKPYLTPDGSKIWLHDNQVIYLFELGTSNPNSSAADFQDAVVLVTLGESVVDIEEPQPPRNDFAVPMPTALNAD
ncbi:MAG: hypothetical protein ED559_02335 [Phycisphaera sp.]|nr:MAG: hypothetical protein ED559_02335 [Phycisphaera sp.]